MGFFGRIRSALVFSVPIAIVGIAVVAAIWTRPPAGPLTAGQVQNLLPPGSTLHSLVRLEMDGRPPLEVAALAAIPLYPGAQDFTYYTFVFAYDRWRQRFARAYAQPLQGPLPLSVDAGRVLGDREAAIFNALHEDGTRSYRVVGSVGRGITLIHEGRLVGKLVVAEPLLIEDGDRPFDQAQGRRRALAWDGRSFREDSSPPVVPPAPGGMTWRYTVRNGTVAARTSSVRLYPRQTLRLAASGGGPVAVVIPDARLDILENGFRARTPGTYTIRILIPFVPIEHQYTLTVLVGGDGAR